MHPRPKKKHLGVRGEFVVFSLGKILDFRLDEHSGELNDEVRNLKEVFEKFLGSNQGEEYPPFLNEQIFVSKYYLRVLVPLVDVKKLLHVCYLFKFRSVKVRSLFLFLLGTLAELFERAQGMLFSHKERSSSLIEMLVSLKKKVAESVCAVLERENCPEVYWDIIKQPIPGKLPMFGFRTTYPGFFRSYEIIRKRLHGLTGKVINCKEIVQLVDQSSVVVISVGVQSSGKSLIMRRLLGLNVFPCGNGAVTRFPVELTVRRRDRDSVLFKHSSIGTKKCRYSDEDVSRVVREVTTKIIGGKDGILDSPLEIVVESPLIPFEMKFIDLPGVPLSEEDDDDGFSSETPMKDTAERIIFHYLMKYPNAVLLLTYQINADIQSSIDKMYFSQTLLKHKLDVKGKFDSILNHFCESSIFCGTKMDLGPKNCVKHLFHLNKTENRKKIRYVSLINVDTQNIEKFEGYCRKDCLKIFLGNEKNSQTLDEANPMDSFLLDMSIMEAYEENVLTETFFKKPKELGKHAEKVLNMSSRNRYFGINALKRHVCQKHDEHVTRLVNVAEKMSESIIDLERTLKKEYLFFFQELLENENESNEEEVRKHSIDLQTLVLSEFEKFAKENCKDMVIPVKEEFWRNSEKQIRNVVSRIQFRLQNRFPQVEERGIQRLCDEYFGSVMMNMKNQQDQFENLRKHMKSHFEDLRKLQLESVSEKVEIIQAVPVRFDEDMKESVTVFKNGINQFIRKMKFKSNRSIDLEIETRVSQRFHLRILSSFNNQMKSSELLLKEKEEVMRNRRKDYSVLRGLVKSFYELLFVLNHYRTQNEMVSFLGDLISKTKKKKEEKRIDVQCKICFEENLREMGKFIIPCGHSLCETCINRIRQTSSGCPFCRKDIEGEGKLRYNS